MARLPDPLDTLDPEAQKVYEKIAARRGAIRGPYAPLMHHPPLAEHVAALGEFIRYHSTLPDDVRELAILVTARAAGQPFEWVMHAPLARKAGVPEELIESVRARQALSSAPARYARPIGVVQHVLANESIPQALQDEVQEALGVSGLLELVTLVGFYRLIAGVLFSFDAPLPEGVAPPF